MRSTISLFRLVLSLMLGLMAFSAVTAFFAMYSRSGVAQFDAVLIGVVAGFASKAAWPRSSQGDESKAATEPPPPWFVPTAFVYFVLSAVAIWILVLAVGSQNEDRGNDATVPIEATRTLTVVLDARSRAGTICRVGSVQPNRTDVMIVEYDNTMLSALALGERPADCVYRIKLPKVPTDRPLYRIVLGGSSWIFMKTSLDASQWTVSVNGS